MLKIEKEKNLPNLHKLDLKEKIFFLISGITISVPFTFFFGRFTDYLCIILPLLYA